MKIAITLLTILFSAAAATADTIWVSPDGADANPGTQLKPFATLQKAQQAARMAKRPVTVTLRGGVYYLPETLVFGPEDSGVAWQAQENETPVISGGAKLDLTWTPYNDGVMQAKTPPGFATDQLFVNGVRQPMARYPNFDPSAQYYNGIAADSISPQRAARWADPTGGFIHAMHSQLWGDFHYLITGKDEKGNLKYEGGWQNNRRMGMHDQYRFVENIFEELDAPGEWFFNSKTATLYFFPPAGLDLSKAKVESVRLRGLVEFRGASDGPDKPITVKGITLKGLRFCHVARTFMDNKEPLLRSDWTTYRGGAVMFNGTEDCSLEDCVLDQVGGNTVFVNNGNRRVTIRGCEIVKAGGNGVAFVGDPKAVRNPLFEYSENQSIKDLDRTPGPKGDNFPANCLVEDCLIHETGRFEKQTAPIQIAMAKEITVRHCSIYDAPRAGVNIGDGCWGGHVIEFCDVFDTVKETGDHGSFNSWGRDRYWGLRDIDVNKIGAGPNKDLPLLDVFEPITLRNSRWRCDHGWDIDLDDGSSNFRIYNNLCLNGGLKLREGFCRKVWNNVIVNNSFHPHVWYENSGDAVTNNIWLAAYRPVGGIPKGNEVDRNFFLTSGDRSAMAGSGWDLHSVAGDPMFVDPDAGDYRVREGSPALKLGFVNFPMDQFGVQKPSLKKIARVPILPNVASGAPEIAALVVAHHWLGLTVKDLEGEEYSAFGVSKESGGVQVLEGKSQGIESGDLIQSVNGKPTKTLTDLMRLQNEAAGKPLEVGIVRMQQAKTVRVASYAFVAPETGTPSTAGAPIRAITTRPSTLNEPVSTLQDGQLAENYGPIFGNGTVGGAYKADLGGAMNIAEINSWSYKHSGVRGRQRFALFGSNAEQDPGWNMDKFTPIIEVDSSDMPAGNFPGTSIRGAGGQPLGRFRWLKWVVYPVTNIGENTAYQEFQVIGSP